jgi:fructosamine-3-kinase
MHKAGQSEKGFGFDVNNTIGSVARESKCPHWAQGKAEDSSAVSLAKEQCCG